MSKNILHTVYIETIRRVLAGCVFLALMASVGYASAQNESDTYRFGLDTAQAGRLPAGWIVSATNPDGPFAQWAVEVDAASAKPENILSIVRIHDTSSSVFNLNWTKKFVFLSGEMSARMRANSGTIDQGWWNDLARAG